MTSRIEARMASVALIALVLSSVAFAEKDDRARTIGSHTGGIASVHFSPDSKLLATGGGDKVIRVWNVADAKPLHEWNGPTSFTCAVRFSPDGNTVAAAGYESGPTNAIYLFDVTTGAELPRLPGHPSGGVRRLAFTPDGKYLVSGGFDGHVRIWDLKTRKSVRAFRVESGTVYSLELSADGRHIVTGGRDGLRLWEFATGKELRREKMNKFNCVAVCFSPDGKLVAAGDGATVKLWDVLTGKEVREFKVFKGEVSQLLFSRDGRRLYTASYDRMVRMWEVRTGKLIHETEAHTGWVWGIALSHDEKQLASCSVDTKLLLWNLSGLARTTSANSTKLSAQQVETHWSELASPDASKAYRAIFALAADPETSLPLLQHRLTTTRASGPSQADIARLIRDLDSNVYKVREQASQQLAEVGIRALPALQKALASPASLEVKKRVQRLLARLDPTELPREDLLALRGVQALEYIATPEARRLLEQFARGDAGSRLGDEANRALRRLQQGGGMR